MGEVGKKGHSLLHRILSLNQKIEISTIKLINLK